LYDCEASRAEVFPLRENRGLPAQAAWTVPRLQTLSPSVQREGPVMEIEYVLAIASLILLLSILASKALSRLGVPALFVFLNRNTQLWESSHRGHRAHRGQEACAFTLCALW